jgi:hypothetical protein
MMNIQSLRVRLANMAHQLPQENSLTQHGDENILGMRGPSAALRISPARSDARKPAQLRLVLSRYAPSELAQHAQI